ncbi:MAG: hypothetical protein ACK5GN_10040 [Pseudomonadota bacterium]|jgi:hypothetical protein
MNTCKKIHSASVELSEEVNGDHNGANPAQIKAAITFVTPAFIAKYITHQATVCLQKEADLVAGFRRYVGELENSNIASTDLTIGDLWSGLIWWRNESSWVGVPGVISFSEVRDLAITSIKAYLALSDAGTSNKDISELVYTSKYAPPLAHRIAQKLQCDGGAPGFRAIVSHAASYYCDGK